MRRLVEEGRIREALPLLDSERRLDPSSPMAEKDLAVAHERLGDRDRALRHWERAIRLAKRAIHAGPPDGSMRPFVVAALGHAADIDRQAGRPGEAARKLAFSLQLDPDRFAVRKDLAEIWMGLGKYRESLRALAAIRDDPRSGPEVWTQMGIACDRIGRTEEAAALWEKAAGDFPLARRLLLGRLHENFLLRFRAGDLDGARKEVEKARAIDPSDRDGIIDAACLVLACRNGGGEADPALDSLALADPAAVHPTRGWGRGEFSPSPDVRPGRPGPVATVCCRDGTRCEAVRMLLERLVAEDETDRAAAIRKSLLQEGCRIVAESLAASLRRTGEAGKED